MKEKPTRAKPQVIIGAAWYAPDEWEAWREACPEFEETHSEWESNATAQIEELKRRGVCLRRVPIRLQWFRDWCRATGRPRDDESRADYVAELLRAQHEKPRQ